MHKHLNVLKVGPIERGVRFTRPKLVIAVADEESVVRSDPGVVVGSPLPILKHVPVGKAEGAKDPPVQAVRHCNGCLESSEPGAELVIVCRVDDPPEADSAAWGDRDAVPLLEKRGMFIDVNAAARKNVRKILGVLERIDGEPRVRYFSAEEKRGVKLPPKLAIQKQLNPLVKTLVQPVVLEKLFYISASGEIQEGVIFPLAENTLPNDDMPHGAERCDMGMPVDKRFSAAVTPDELLSPGGLGRQGYKHARGAPGGATGDSIALDKDNAPRAEPVEEIGERNAGHAAADDEVVAGSLPDEC